MIYKLPSGKTFTSKRSALTYLRGMLHQKKVVRRGEPLFDDLAYLLEALRGYHAQKSAVEFVSLHADSGVRVFYYDKRGMFHLWSIYRALAHIATEA